nr:hypothetical protein [Rickettsia endosymbiont of Ceutorhynchus assimilis]
MPTSVHATSGSIEPIIPPAIKGGKLGQYLRAVILAISPTDPMAIAAYDANFFRFTDDLKNDKFVIPLLVSGIYAEIPQMNRGMTCCLGQL